MSTETQDAAGKWIPLESNPEVCYDHVPMLMAVPIACVVPLGDEYGTSAAATGPIVILLVLNRSGLCFWE